MRIIADKQTSEEHNNKISRLFAREPPSFGEDIDPWDAKHWILKLENILYLIDCSNKQKVSFVSLRLNDVALYWSLIGYIYMGEV